MNHSKETVLKTVSDLFDLVKEKQSKVDELQKQRDSFIKAYEIEIDKSVELQKRVDQQGLIIAKVMSIASDLQKSWVMFEIGKKLEQALKGGGE